MAYYCVDASIFLTAWYVGYPIHILSPLWREIANHKNEIIIIEPIYDEIEPIPSADKKMQIADKKAKYPLRMWLIENGFTETPVDDGVNATSLELERDYETSGISKGAGSNDICLIAYAKVNNNTVVTFESKQPQKPKKKCDYKIPLICHEQGVDCIDFVEMIDRLGIRI